MATPNVGGVSDPRFRPKDYVGARQFGKIMDVGSIDWQIPDGGSPEFLWGAVIQHVQSFAIRYAIKEKGFKGLHHLCDVRSLPYEVLGGVLRGDDILRVEHLGLFVFHLGAAVVVPSPTVVERMMVKAAKTHGYPRKL